MKKFFLAIFLLCSCKTSILNLNKSVYVSDRDHFGVASELIFDNGFFYYFERGGMFYSQGNVKLTDTKTKFILISDLTISNQYLYKETRRDSTKEKEMMREGKPVLDGFIEIKHKILTFKNRKIYFEGHVFKLSK